MSRFQDPYLAESVGYNNGHALGFNQGMEQGHVKGWNDAMAEMNPTVDRCNAAIARLQAECARLQNEVARVTAGADDMHSAGLRVSHENERLQELLRLQQEQAQSLRADYDGMFMAFKGAVSIINPAMRMIASMDLQERDYFVTAYAKNAVEIQTREYIKANGAPHEQPLILQYAPIAKNVIGRVLEEAREARSAASQQVHVTPD